MMRRIFSASLVVVCASVAISLSSCDQTTPAGVAADKDASVESQQPRPEEVLRRMADYLAELPAFACRIASKIDIKASGMDNRMVTKMSVRLVRPNRIAITVQEGVMGMTVVSDGKQLIQFLPMMSRYTVQEAPADFSSFNEVGGAAGASMIGMSGVVIPTSGDEFYNALMANVTSSEYLGTEQVGDANCHRCRFVQEQFNWEIWIEAGERPIVHKIVPDLSKQFAEAGGMLENAKIEYSVVFSDWNVSPQFTDADFAFDPPADAEKVDSLFEGLAGGGEDAGPHPLLGQPAPAFETVDLEGQAIDLSTHLGKDMVLLDFWATWCGPCVEAMPDVDAVAEKYADRGLVFYAVNVGEDAATAKEFLAESELEVPVAMDPDGSISDSYKVDGIPQTVLVGQDGKVQVVHVGFSSALGKELTQNIEDLLAGKDLAGEALAEAEATDAEQPAGEDGSIDASEPAGEAQIIETEEPVGDGPLFIDVDDKAIEKASPTDESADTETADE